MMAPATSNVSGVAADNVSVRALRRSNPGEISDGSLISKLEDDVAKLKENVESADITVNALELNTTTLNNAHPIVSGDINSIKVVSEEYDGKIDEVITKVRTIRETVAKSNKSVDTLTTKFDPLFDKVGALKSDIATTQDKLVLLLQQLNIEVPPDTFKDETRTTPTTPEEELSKHHRRPRTDYKERAEWGTAFVNAVESGCVSEREVELRVAIWDTIEESKPKRTTGNAPEWAAWFTAYKDLLIDYEDNAKEYNVCWHCLKRAIPAQYMGFRQQSEMIYDQAIALENHLNQYDEYLQQWKEKYYKIDRSTFRSRKKLDKTEMHIRRIFKRYGRRDTKFLYKHLMRMCSDTDAIDDNVYVCNKLRKKVEILQDAEDGASDDVVSLAEIHFLSMFVMFKQQLSYLVDENS